jgi:hypothetical protein
MKQLGLAQVEHLQDKDNSGALIDRSYDWGRQYPEGPEHKLAQLAQ